VVVVEPVLQLDALGFDGALYSGNLLRAMTPIVPAVFFDSASATIPADYRRQLDASVVPDDAVLAHAWVMPRIARTLLRNPKGRITIIGSTSGDMPEADALDMAKRRADAVKTVFVDMGIDASRITTRGSVLPGVVSNRDFAGGRIENHRADIVIDNAPLQEWVTTEAFNELRGTLRVGSDARSTGTERVAMRIHGRDTVVATGRQTIDAPIEMQVAQEQSVATLDLQATSGAMKRQKDTTIVLSTLPRNVRALVADDFSAVLRFDYNSADLNDDVKALLRQLVEQLPPGSEINIQGSADVLGSEARNRELSQQRASVTTAFVRSIAGSNLTIVSGTTAEKFSDDTPQGRFLNRSIRVRVTLR
jgi:outer membrane protein OmpA-like peptidoglycan-associated protein